MQPIAKETHSSVLLFEASICNSFYGDYAIFNKPPNVSVAGDGKTAEEDNIQFLDMVKAYYENKNYNHIPALLHRLDKVCSGIMVFGKTKQAERHFQNLLQFRKETIGKGYTAVTRGVVEKNHGTLKGTLISTPGNFKRYSLVDSKKNSIRNLIETKYKVIDRKLEWDTKSGIIKKKSEEEPAPAEEATEEGEKKKAKEDCTLLAMRLLTGKSHQARASASGLSSPIVGDELYGGRKFLNQDQYVEGALVPTTLLHSTYLIFPNVDPEEPYYEMFCSPWSWWNPLRVEKIEDGEMLNIFQKLCKPYAPPPDKPYIPDRFK
ncbi:hypothetical protein PROFUN_12686 [Planoprotostelium fungivorum]|uniref:Pseudouridine synthase RsuA/RluA-like domain-containing protein n=1 Tax=Planoprotostelium fungivorum TaxID=1890364 RepID=A0A2P6N6X7_9EUKA|nr:hypothetical protein PROFUN_12686 [Planoprotostelium fungivorum]